jgi:hypothetical protein
MPTRRKTAAIASWDPAFSAPFPLALPLTAVWTLGGIVLLLIAPLTAPELAALSLLAPLAWMAANREGPLWHYPTAIFIALYLATGYLALNTRWSPDPATALATVALVFLLVVVLDTILVAFEKNRAPVLFFMTRGFIGGTVIGGAYLCFEVVSGQWLRRTLAPLLPWLQPEAIHLSVSATGAVAFQPYLLNLNISALAMIFWPAVLAITALKPAPSRGRLLRLALSPAVVAIFCSVHATSKLALLGGLVIYLLYRAKPALARALTLTSWAAATLLVVPIASWLFAEKLYTAPWLFHSAQERIVFWGYTSAQVAKAPLLGAGIAATRVYHKVSGGPNAPLVPGSQFRYETGWHSHNVYLQAWYETGAIGAIFLLAIGLIVLRSFAAAPTAAHPFLWATFAACAIMGSASFSLWAPWFIAALGVVAILAGLGTALVAKGEVPP